MNTLVLLCNKLRLVAQYCDDGPQENAIRGMADAVGVLTEVAGQMMTVMQTRPGAGVDAPAFLGSLQLVLDAMQKKDVKMLAGALRDGLLPEL